MENYLRYYHEDLRCFPLPGMLCISGLVLLASGDSAFPPDNSWLCISIPNSVCFFPFSFDQVVMQPGRPSSQRDRRARPRAWLSQTPTPRHHEGVRGSVAEDVANSEDSLKIQP